MASQFTQLDWETATVGPNEKSECKSCRVELQPRTIYFMFNDEKFCTGKCLTEYEWDNHDDF